MENFTLARAETMTKAAQAASTTVADAMISLNAANAADIAVIKAGGVDLLDLMKEHLLKPGMVVSLQGIPGLDTISEEQGGVVRIGPMITLAGLAAHPLIRDRAPALTEAAQGSASPQIRNVATLGGNLLQRPRCWYFRAAQYHCLRKGGGHCFAIPGENQYHAVFDNQTCAIVHPSTVATVLVALGATIELTNAENLKRNILLENFFIKPDSDVQRENDLKPRELLTAIRLPALAPNLHMAHFRQGEKAAFDWPLADVAVVLDLDQSGNCMHASIVLGAAAPVPYRAKAAEAVLTGKRIDENAARDAAHAALQGATPFPGNAYKLPLFETLVRRAILEAVG